MFSLLFSSLYNFSLYFLFYTNLIFISIFFSCLFFSHIVFICSPFIIFLYSLCPQFFSYLNPPSLSSSLFISLYLRVWPHTLLLLLLHLRLLFSFLLFFLPSSIRCPGGSQLSVAAATRYGQSMYEQRMRANCPQNKS